MLYLVSLDCPEVRLYDDHARREMRTASFLAKALPMAAMNTIWTLGGEHALQLAGQMTQDLKEPKICCLRNSKKGVCAQLDGLAKISKGKSTIAVLPPSSISRYLGSKTAGQAKVLAPCGGTYRISDAGTNLFAALHRLNPQTKQWDEGYYTKADSRALDMLAQF